MKALVTGPSGPSGQYVVEHLLTTPTSIRVLALPETLHRVPFRSEIEIIPGCVEDDVAVAEALDGVDFVYHTATVMPPPRRAPEDMMSVNSAGTRRLLEAAADRVKRFVFISTVSVYAPHDNPDSWPVKDDSDRALHGNPQLQAYAKSMIAAEDAVLQAHREHGLEYTILRPTMVLGRNARFADQLIGSLLKNPQQIESLHTRVGTMQWVHGIDVARAAHLAAENPAAANEVFIVAGPDSITCFDLLSHLWTLINPHDPDNPFEADALKHRAQRNKFDYGKLQRALGYQPTTSIPQCLMEVIGRLEFFSSAGIRLPQRPRLHNYKDATPG